jgi:hypothetical protein
MPVDITLSLMIIALSIHYTFSSKSLRHYYANCRQRHDGIVDTLSR